MLKLVPSDAVLIPDSAHRVFAGVIFDTYQWSQPVFDGPARTFEMVRRPDTVQAICVVNGSILLINDEQPHAGTRLSFPGGRVDREDTNTQAAAAREVKEETGYTFENWRMILVAQPTVKMEWFVYTFLAWGVQQHALNHLDGGERVAFQLVDLASVKQAVDDNEIIFPEGRPLLRHIIDTKDLLSIPDFSGVVIDR